MLLPIGSPAQIPRTKHRLTFRNHRLIIRPVLRVLKSDVTKLILYLLACFLLAGAATVASIAFFLAALLQAYFSLASFSCNPQ